MVDSGVKEWTAQAGFQHWAVLGCVFLLQFSYFSFVGLHRFIDGDEGHYLLASRLVLNHQRPYVDFFYNQAPLLPYVYGIWIECFGSTWTSGRLLSSMLAALLGTSLYDHLRQQTGSWLASVSGIVLFVSSTLVFAWFSVVKTHALAGVLLFSAYALTTRPGAISRRSLLAGAGVFLGLSVDSRSYLLLLTPVFLWWIVRSATPQARIAAFFWFLGGFAAGLLPSLYLYLSSPDAFVFNNLGYHALRSGGGLVGWWEEKLVIVLQLFLLGRESNGLQWSVLFFVSIGLLSGLRRLSAPRLAFVIAVALGLICLLPTPAYLQYFSLCVPFLIVSAVGSASTFIAYLENAREKRIAAVVSACVLTIYVAAAAHDFRSYLVTGDGVPGVERAEDRGDWTLARVREVSHAVEQITTPGEVVASFWPGDIFQSTVAPLSGLENPFALPVADRLTPQQRIRYHILSPDEIQMDFAAHTPRVIVLRNQILAAVTREELRRMHGLVSDFRISLINHGYVVVRTTGGITVYVRNSKSE